MTPHAREIRDIVERGVRAHRAAHPTRDLDIADVEAIVHECLRAFTDHVKRGLEERARRGVQS